MGVRTRRFPKGDRKLRLFSCPLVASAEAKPLRPKANSYAESTSPKAKNRHRASISLPMAFFWFFTESWGKSSLGARLRTRKVTGRDASLPAPLLSAFKMLAARGTVGALPQAPQGTLALDPARGRRKGTKSPLDPLRAIGLVALSCSFRVQLLMLRLSPCLLPQLSVKNQMNLEIIPLLPESSAPRYCGGSFPPAAA